MLALLLVLIGSTSTTGGGSGGSKLTLWTDVGEAATIWLPDPADPES